jgi:hypothetical protein
MAMTQSNEERLPGHVPGTARSNIDAAEAPVPQAGSVPPTDSVPQLNDQLGGTIAALADEDLDAAGLRHTLGRLAGQLKERGVGDLFKPTAAMKWITDAVSDVVPHLPIRDLNTLREHFAGMSDEEIADRLVRNAARATAAIGAAGGGIAAVEWVATPTLLTAPRRLPWSAWRSS